MLRFLASLVPGGLRFLDAEPGAGGGGSATATPPATQQPAPGATQPATPAAGTQSVVDQLVQRVGATLDERLGPLQQQVAAQAQQIAAMAAPVANVQGLFGGPGSAPGQIRGQLPSKVERQGYRISMAAGLAMESAYADDQSAKYELHVHRQLHRHFVQQHGLELGSGKKGSILIPLGAEYLPDDLPEKAEFAEAMRQSVRGGVDVERLHWQAAKAGVALHPGVIRQTLSMYDDMALGIFRHDGPQGDMIELLRAQEVFSRVGATNVTLPPSGKLPWGEQTGATTAYWVGENAEITASEPTTGSKNMQAKKLAALTNFPNELIRFATQSVEQFLRADIARVMALKFDRSCIDGVGSTNAVKGLLNYTGIKTVLAGTVATDGNTLGPNDGSRVLAKLENENHDVEGGSFAFVMRPLVWQDIYTRRADAVTAADEAGPYLFQTNRANIANGQPARWDGQPVVKSTQVPNNRAKGSGTALTLVLAGLFKHMLIGRVGVIEFARADQHSTNFAFDQMTLRAIQHLDMIPRYENAFALIDTLVEPS